MCRCVRIARMLEACHTGIKLRGGRVYRNVKRIITVVRGELGRTLYDPLKLHADDIRHSHAMLVSRCVYVYSLFLFPHSGTWRASERTDETGNFN